MTDLLPDLTDAVDAAARGHFDAIKASIGLQLVTFYQLNPVDQHWLREFVTPLVTAAAPAVLTAERARATAQLHMAGDEVLRGRDAGDLTPGVAHAAMDALERAAAIVNGTAL